MAAKVCAIYARQSIDKADSISVESQVEQCIFEARGAPYQVYCDRGFSGKNIGRPQFQAMLDAIHRGEIERVICYKLDRCSRSVLDFTQLMATFQQYGVEFISCTEKFDTGTPMGRAMLNICIVFAQLERETIQQRITDAYHSRCKKGFYMGGRIPFGYSLSPYSLDGKKTACYKVIPEEAEILAHIYRVYSEPSASLSDVVLSLNELRITNPRREDGQWVRSHLGRMMKNPIYVRADQTIYNYYKQSDAILDNPPEDFIGENGCYLYRLNGETHLVLAPHKGIVSSYIWLQCQKKGAEKKRRYNTKEIPSWLIGKLKCAKCGRAMIAKQINSKNGKNYRYFMCSGTIGKNRQCKGFKSIPAKKLELIASHSIVTYVHKLLINDRPNPEIQNQLHQKLLELAALSENSNDALANIEYTLLDLSSQLKSLRNKENATNWLCNQDTMNYVCNRLADWSSLNILQKQSIANLLIATISVKEKHITIFWQL